MQLFSRIVWFSLIGALLSSGLSTETASSNELKLGVAEIEITPPVGWRMAGNYYEKFSTGVHDPLMAKAMVWKQNGTAAVLVLADLTSLDREITDPAREIASRKTGIPAEHITICATHTHGGPEYYGVLRDHFHESAVARLGRDPHEPIDYKKELIDRLVTVIKAAGEQCTAVSTQVTLARQPNLAHNRRYLMKDGTVRFNPARQDPNIVRAAGPVDVDLPVLFFSNARTEAPLASLTNYAMHVAVFGGTELGADFPSLLQLRLRERYGSQFLSVFGQGTAGDTNHFRFLSDQPDPTSGEVGTILSDTVIRSLEKLEPTTPAALAVRSVKVSAPLREVTQEEVDRAWKVLRREWVPEPAFLVLVEAWRVLNNERLIQQYGTAMPLEIHAFRLNSETAIVTLPHEVFVELGLAIKKASPFKYTLIITMANAMDFYVPTKKAHAEGSYEVVTSPLKPGSGEILVDAASQLLAELNDRL